MKKITPALTLMELMIALALFSMVVMAAASMQVFGRNQLVTAQQRAKLQNELALLLGHMKQQGLRTIGRSSNNDVQIATLGGYPCLYLYIDGNNNGLREDPVAGGDHLVAYVHRTDLYQVRFYANAGAAPAINLGDANEVVANNISTVGWAYAANTNFVTLTGLTARWRPAQACGVGNPCVVMDSAIYMPSLSTN